jgi:hypothetical protein
MSRIITLDRADQLVRLAFDPSMPVVGPSLVSGLFGMIYDGAWDEVENDPQTEANPRNHEESCHYRFFYNKSLVDPFLKIGPEWGGNVAPAPPLVNRMLRLTLWAVRVLQDQMRIDCLPQDNSKRRVYRTTGLGPLGRPLYHPRRVRVESTNFIQDNL